MTDDDTTGGARRPPKKTQPKTTEEAEVEALKEKLRLLQSENLAIERRARELKTSNDLMAEQIRRLEKTLAERTVSSWM